MRLQKYMAQCGVGSRRTCETIISEGRVSVNGIKVTEQGVSVNPQSDLVTVDGTLLFLPEKMVYLMLNKPKGVVTTVSDQFGRKSVIDLIDLPMRLFPVGRLDYDTEGLLFLTNDGEFTYRLTHPSHEMDKCYLCTVTGTPGAEVLTQLEKGVLLDGQLTAPAKAELIEQGRGKSVVKLTIHEGRNRQVRRMMETVGYPVEELKRISVGGVTLGSLEVGQWRYLTEQELKQLQ